MPERDGRQIKYSSEEIKNIREKDQGLEVMTKQWEIIFGKQIEVIVDQYGNYFIKERGDDGLINTNSSKE